MIRVLFALFTGCSTVTLTVHPIASLAANAAVNGSANGATNEAANASFNGTANGEVNGGEHDQAYSASEVHAEASGILMNSAGALHVLYERHERGQTALFAPQERAQTRK
jgi:hypothetical protein